MAYIEIDRQLLKKEMDLIVSRTMQMDLVWDWPCGVAYDGIAKAYEATGDQAYLDALKDRVDELIDLNPPRPFNVNRCAMGHCLISLYQATGEETYWDLVMEKIDYLRHDALRFGDHVLQHTVSDANDFPGQCWADTLFMAAYFMLRVGVILKDEDLIGDALNQYVWHIRYLQDPASGLWYHGYSSREQSHMSGFFWGRANAWAAYTMSQVEHVLPEAYLYPPFMDVSGSLDEQLSALKLKQTENGLWRTLLDDEESYEEISASAGIAAAMVSHGNPLHKKYVEKALNGILGNIDTSGRVLNVSGGTAIMRDREGYRTISRRWTQGWGQGLVLDLLAGLIKDA